MSNRQFFKGIVACLALMIAFSGAVFLLNHGNSRPEGVAENWLEAIGDTTRKGVEADATKRADEIGNEALDGRPRRRGQPPPEPIAPRTRSASPAGPKAPAAPVTDSAVRDDALAILLSAAQAWAAKGLSAVPVEAVWDQLWSVLEEGGVLKKKKAK